MTKAEIVRKLSAETGMDRASVMNIVDGFMKEVKSSIYNRESVYLRGFGTFEVKRRASKPGRNIRTGVTMMIPERDVASFRPSREFTVSEQE